MKNVLKVNDSTVVTRVKEGTFRYIEQASEEGIGIRYGGVISCSIEAQCFYKSDGTTEISDGDVLYYYQEFDVDMNFNPVTPARQLLIGIFTVEKCTHENFMYHFVAYDNIHKLDADFSSSLYSMRNFFPQPLKAFMGNLATFCSNIGAPLDLNSCNCYAYAQDMNINQFYSSGISARDIVAYIAGFCMQYARCNQYGTIVFTTFSQAPRTGYTQWNPSSSYIISPTDQATYLDDNNQPLTPVFYKENGLSRAEYYFADIDDYQVFLSDGSILYRDSFAPLTSLLNPYCIVDNVIATNLNQDDAWWMDATYAGYAALQTLISSHNVTPFEVHLFPFRCPFSAGQIVPYIEDAKGTRFQSVIMKLELTDSEVVLSCAGPEYYYTDSSKNNDVAETTTAIAAELNNKVSKSGDTINGVLTVNSLVDIRRSGSSGNGLAIDDTSADATTPPSADTNRLPLVFRDANNVIMATVRARQLADGKNGVYMYGSNNGQNNYLMLTIDSSGNKGVALNAQAEWLSALGLSVSNTSVVSDIASAGTSCTISAADFAQQGKVAQLRIVWSRSASVASGNTTIAVLASGKRPIFNALATCHTNHDLVAYVNANGNVVVNGPITAGSSYTLYATYILA